jgi:hypothetical protein
MHGEVKLFRNRFNGVENLGEGRVTRFAPVLFISRVYAISVHVANGIKETDKVGVSVKG